MYIRFKIKKRKKGNETLIAVLVKSIWLAGKIYQKQIKYLGSIRKEKINIVQKRRSFWIKGLAKLKTIDLNNGVQEKLMDQINKVVPMPENLVTPLGKRLQENKKVYPNIMGVREKLLIRSRKKPLSQKP